MRNPGRVFSAEALINRVWLSDSEASSETVRTYVKRLREKIDRPDKPSYIRTLHGIGYVFEGPQSD